MPLKREAVVRGLQECSQFEAYVAAGKASRTLWVIHVLSALRSAGCREALRLPPDATDAELFQAFAKFEDKQRLLMKGGCPFHSAVQADTHLSNLARSSPKTAWEREAQSPTGKLDKLIGETLRAKCLRNWLLILTGFVSILALALLIIAGRMKLNRIYYTWLGRNWWAWPHGFMAAAFFGAIALSLAATLYLLRYRCCRACCRCFSRCFCCCCYDDEDGYCCYADGICGCCWRFARCCKCRRRKRTVQAFQLGELVERRDAGKEWGTGYVTSLNPVRVTADDNPEADGCRWDEVRQLPGQVFDEESRRNSRTSINSSWATRSSSWTMRSSLRSSAHISPTKRELAMLEDFDPAQDGMSDLEGMEDMPDVPIPDAYSLAFAMVSPNNLRTEQSTNDVETTMMPWRAASPASERPGSTLKSVSFQSGNAEDLIYQGMPTTVSVPMAKAAPAMHPGPYISGPGTALWHDPRYAFASRYARHAGDAAAEAANNPASLPSGSAQMTKGERGKTVLQGLVVDFPVGDHVIANELRPHMVDFWNKTMFQSDYNYPNWHPSSKCSLKQKTEVTKLADKNKGRRMKRMFTPLVEPHPNPPQLSVTAASLHEGEIQTFSDLANSTLSSGFGSNTSEVDHLVGVHHPETFGSLDDSTRLEGYAGQAHQDEYGWSTRAGPQFALPEAEQNPDPKAQGDAPGARQRADGSESPESPRSPGSPGSPTGGGSRWNLVRDDVLSPKSVGRKRSESSESPKSPKSPGSPGSPGSPKKGWGKVRNEVMSPTSLTNCAKAFRSRPNRKEASSEASPTSQQVGSPTPGSPTSASQK